LQKNSKRPGLRLKPQNSFVRRQQHMVAEEHGYATESVGEGKERAVFLKNKGG
jgi:predicted RNA-binding protein Jag